MFQVCCRLCLQQTSLKNSTSLFDTRGEATIRDEVYELFDIKIEDTDKLSTACSECVEKISSVQKIKKFFQDANRTYQELVVGETCSTSTSSAPKPIEIVKVESTTKELTMDCDDTDQKEPDVQEDGQIMQDPIGSPHTEPLPTLQPIANGSSKADKDAEASTTEGNTASNDEYLLKEQENDRVSILYDEDLEERKLDLDDNQFFQVVEVYSNDSNSSFAYRSASAYPLDDGMYFEEHLETETDELVEVADIENVNDDIIKPSPKCVHQCNVCNISFTTRIQLTQHFSKAHGETHPLCCTSCLQVFTNSQKLKDHVCKQQQITPAKRKVAHKATKPPKRYACDVCGNLFYNDRQLIGHIQREHDPTFVAFQCPKCLKQCGSKKSLDLHLDNHERLFKCAYCSKTCLSQLALNGHENTHTKSQSYRCEKCDRSFGQYTSLRRHMKIHSNEKPYKCDFCDLQFRQRTVMLTHRRLHTGEKPYQCQFCTLSFRDHSVLAKHKRVHTKTPKLQARSKAKKVSELSFDSSGE